ncbi:ribosomal protein S18-alanine N-acetyltransferase [Fundicoccus sp. Sow4_F4]|uniref:ribosomal protein S18-alanine N-acetyltransferase n=1 Tax=Fundicoccus sp. Sow4_F4 TaxID=3438783 RepID=UPI003F925588
MSGTERNRGRDLEREALEETVLNVKVVPFRGIELPQVLRSQIIVANEATFAWSTAMSEADFANAQSEYYVMVRDRDELLAYVSLHHILDEATINTVFVEPSWRQLGLGLHLFNFVLDQLAARDILNLFLEVRAKNVPARALYRAAGFEELVVRQGYYEDPADDAVIMQKHLAGAGQGAGAGVVESDEGLEGVKQNQERGAGDESDSSD